MKNNFLLKHVSIWKRIKILTLYDVPNFDEMSDDDLFQYKLRLLLYIRNFKVLKNIAKWIVSIIISTTLTFTITAITIFFSHTNEYIRVAKSYWQLVGLVIVTVLLIALLFGVLGMFIYHMDNILWWREKCINDYLGIEKFIDVK